MEVTDLVDAVEAAFAVTGRGLSTWPNPHADRSPNDDEYSRTNDAGRWRIVGARADAWLVALEDAGLARVDRDTEVTWVTEPGTRLSRADLAVPHRPGALPLVVARSAIGDVPDAGITLGVGDPATCIAWLPDCGCDACDSGSQNELDQVDQVILGVVAGTFRRLTSGSRQITQLDPGGWSASGRFDRRGVDAVLADPQGWDELSGSAWTDPE